MSEGNDVSTLRFEKFTQSILPEVLNAHPLRQVLIFVPSSFDYVILRKHCHDHDVNAMYISEDSSQGRIAHSRSAFASKKCHILFITERMYFYWRYHIKGIEQVVFYGPPEVPVFYSEIINSVQDDSHTAKVTLIYSKYDYISLSRILGKNRAAKMCSDTRVERKAHLNKY